MFDDLNKKIEPINNDAQKSAFDFSTMESGNMHVLEGLALKKVLDDVILVAFDDEPADGMVMRGGLLVPLSHTSKAWRTGRVVLIGHRVKEVSVNDTVMFPNNLGIVVNDVNIVGADDKISTIKKAIFINENRIFGIGKRLD